MMEADEFYDSEPWVDLSEEELLQGLQRFAGVGIQQMSNEDFCRQIFRVLKTDASVPGCLCENVPCGNALLTAGSRRW